MKTIMLSLIALVVLGSLALAGCGNDEEKKVSADKVKKEAIKSINTAVSYTKQKQEELMASAKIEYQEIEKETSRLMDKAQEKASAGQEKAKEVMVDLEKKRDAVRGKLEAMQTSSGEVWLKAKVELEEALKSLKDACQKAMTELSG